MHACSRALGGCRAGGDRKKQDVLQVSGGITLVPRFLPSGSDLATGFGCGWGSCWAGGSRYSIEATSHGKRWIGTDVIESGRDDARQRSFIHSCDDKLDCGVTVPLLQPSTIRVPPPLFRTPERCK
jgi:hypothetical protein